MKKVIQYTKSIIMQLIEMDTDNDLNEQIVLRLEHSKATALKISDYRNALMQIASSNAANKRWTLLRIISLLEADIASWGKIKNGTTD